MRLCKSNRNKSTATPQRLPENPAPLFSGSPTTFRRKKPCNKKSVSKSKA
ncbi:hypothetical protein NEISUBOT_04178 [Neisseria subflava NJ9703]|uniref:Uncharacterized protein n=1 Tax=Neisseria subflava NJ9703 TaxID=546268 RepID=A0A9W5MZI3_NEISU|nr:hypothetical protein NEISUBOT_04178 [Neisseria subflava NJ9703]